jgi:hypothetical protein
VQLFGGTSEERDVSIASAAQIIPVLRDLGHQVFAVDTATGRLGYAQERQLLAAGVTAAPPSDTEIARVRGGAMALSPSAFDFREADVVFLALHVHRILRAARANLPRGDQGPLANAHTHANANVIASPSYSVSSEPARQAVEC